MAKAKKKQTQQADLGSLIRAGLNAAGGALATKGYIAGSMVEPLSGALLTLVSLGMSMSRNRKDTQT